MDLSTLGLPSAQSQEIVRAHEQRTDELRVIFIALIPASVMAVILRLVSRRLARMRLWWDDYMTFAALGFAIGLNVALLLSTYHGLGKHVEFVGPEETMKSGQIEYFAEIIYMIAMATIKISILLFYFRLFGSDHRMRIAVWVMGTVTVCWYITSTFVAIFQCDPIPYFWDRSIPGGQCIRCAALWIGNSVSSLVTDVAILCLPLPIIWGMNVTPRQKVAISGMFLLGACVCITSILRVFTVNELGNSDPTWTDVASAIWTSVECSTAVICGCLPTYKPLFRGLLGSVRKIRRDSVTSLTPLSATGTLRKGSDSSTKRKCSDYSIVSPKQPYNEQFRFAANEKRMENVGLGMLPHFEEVDYSANGKENQAEKRGMTETRSGQDGQPWNRSAVNGVQSVRLSDHVVSPLEDRVSKIYQRDWESH